jgi:hypothetical protein
LIFIKNDEKNHLEIKKNLTKKSNFLPIVKVAKGQKKLFTLFSANMDQHM